MLAENHYFATLVNGNPSDWKSTSARSRVCALVTTVTSKLKIFRTSSPIISGNTICSRIPMFKLPCSSIALALIPRKSRVRGIAKNTRRSRKSYIRFPRSVTRYPITIPLRVLNEAIATRAGRGSGNCPVIFIMEVRTSSFSFSSFRRPIPTFTTTFSMRGTAWILDARNRSRNAGIVTLLYVSVRCFIGLREIRFAFFTHTDLGIAPNAVSNARSFFAIRADKLDIGNDNRMRNRNALAFLALAAWFRVANPFIDALNHYFSVSWIHFYNFTGLPVILPADHRNRIAFFNFKESYHNTSSAREIIFV